MYVKRFSSFMSRGSGGHFTLQVLWMKYWYVFATVRIYQITVTKICPYSEEIIKILKTFQRRHEILSTSFNWQVYLSYRQKKQKAYRTRYAFCPILGIIWVLWTYIRSILKGEEGFLSPLLKGEHPYTIVWLQLIHRFLCIIAQYSFLSNSKFIL